MAGGEEGQLFDSAPHHEAAMIGVRAAADTDHFALTYRQLQLVLELSTSIGKKHAGMIPLSLDTDQEDRVSQPEKDGRSERGEEHGPAPIVWSAVIARRRIAVAWRTNRPSSPAAGDRRMMSYDRSTAIDCPHGEACGACALLGIAYPAQLGRKRRILGAALEHYPTLARAELLSCLESPVVEKYRNRAKMAVGLSKGRQAKLGYFRAGTREITDAPDCRVLIPEILETSRALRGVIATVGSIPRELRHVDIRCGSDPGRQHLILVLRSDKLPRLPIDKIRRACRRVDGISVNLNPSAGPLVLKGAILPLWGAREVYAEVADLTLRISPGAFFQVNLALLPEIHRTMAEFLDSGDVLADLYSGVGTHGLALRRRFRRVVCIEGARSAVADTKATLKRYQLTGVEVIAKPVERALEPLVAANADCVVMNPSRAGAKLSVLEALAASRARKIVYLSCDPATLCRDLDFLVESGFRLVSAQPIDMMPQTRQVEAIALLRR